MCLCYLCTYIKGRSGRWYIQHRIYRVRHCIGSPVKYSNNFTTKRNLVGKTFHIHLIGRGFESWRGEVENTVDPHCIYTRRQKQNKKIYSNNLPFIEDTCNKKIEIVFREILTNLLLLSLILKLQTPR